VNIPYSVFLFPSTTAEKQEVRRAILNCSLSAIREEEAYEDWSDDNEEI